MVCQGCSTNRPATHRSTYANPHSSMGKTAPTSLHTSSRRPFGSTNSTAELCCYFEKKRKLICRYKQEICCNRSLFLDRLLASSFFLSSIQPSIVLTSIYFTDSFRSVSGTNPIKNALCSIDWWFSPFIYTIFDCDTMTTNPWGHSFRRWFFNKFVDVVMK